MSCGRIGVLALAAAALATGCDDDDDLDIVAPEGFEVEGVVQQASYLVDVTFAPDGTMYVASAGGHTYGTTPKDAPPPVIWEIPPGKRGRPLRLKVLPLEVIQSHLSSADMPEGIITPITGVTFHEGLLYVSHRSRVSTLDPKTGELRTIVNGLPSWGEFLNAKVIFGPDGKMVFAQSTQGNAGVIDEHWAQVIDIFGKRNAQEIPCEDVTLTGEDFPVPTGKKPDLTFVPTGVYVPLGKTTEPGMVVEGMVPCNGAMLRSDPDGSNLELIAWGLRSLFGYRYSQAGRLVATQNSGNPLAPRPVYDDTETIWEIRPGLWYGWPDYFSGIPITDPRFSRPNDPSFEGTPFEHEFVLTEETRNRLLRDEPLPPQPLVQLTPHAAVQGMVFGREEWGMDPENEVLVAELGTIVLYQRQELPGFRVVRVNLATGEVTDFLRNRSGKPASRSGERGLERPIQLTWGPDGALYVVDFGRIELEKNELNAYTGTAAVWRVRKAE